MDRYVEQLLEDIAAARAHAPTPWFDPAEADGDGEDDERDGLDPALLAPRRSIEAWTGIPQLALPPADRLTEAQARALYQALKDLLSAFRCHIVFQQSDVPLKLRYSVVRRRFHQDMPLARASDHFFAFCEPGQAASDCLLGPYCECRFLDAFLHPGPGGDRFVPGLPAPEDEP